MIQSRKDKYSLRDIDLNVCYCDESGMGQEPIATMVGIIVDSSRMHLTTQDWDDLLNTLSEIIGKSVIELHSSDFYAGNGIWRAIDGSTRAILIDKIFDWLIERKHSIVFSSVQKEIFKEIKENLPPEINSPWRLLALHLVLAVQKYSQPSKIPKGNTFMIFDNRSIEEKYFTQIIRKPPVWSGEYYGKSKKQPPLDQIVDRCPVFSGSHDRPLLQVADFLAFFLRRYAEITEGCSTCKYDGEDVRLNDWIAKFKSRIISSNHIYLKRGQKPVHEYFNECASPSLRKLICD